MGRATKQNKLTSPELFYQVNPDNKDLLYDYLTYLQSTQHSPGTIKGYKNDLEIFFVWCLQNCHNKHFTEMTKREFIAYQNWLLTENENSPARVRRVKSALSGLSDYIETVLDDEFKNYKPVIKKIKNPPNRPVREKTVWEDAELEDLLSKLSEAGEHEKACVVALAMYSGRRKAELPRFRVSDFDDDKLVCDGALYKSAPIQTKGRAGGKFIPCYTLAKRFKPYLDAWMQQREELGIESEWLFPDRNDPTQQLVISTLNSWTETFSKMTGKTFYFHSLRHAWTTSMVRAGLPDSVIAQIIGWDSVEMCRIYTDIDAEEQVGMYFADGDIKAPDRKGFSDL